MIIIAGYSHWKDIEERDAAVAAFAPMVGRARKHDGCIHMAITADLLIGRAATSLKFGATSRRGRDGEK